LSENSELWALRKERNSRWIKSGALDLCGYPTQSAEEETEETQAAEPPERAGKKHNSQSE
jgi:hypothetical protein